MKLFLISQNVNNSNDTYDSAVVAAENEEQARNTHPASGRGYEIDWEEEAGEYGSWCMPEDVKVEYLGEAADSIKLGVVLASFNAG